MCGPAKARVSQVSPVGSAVVPDVPVPALRTALGGMQGMVGGAERIEFASSMMRT